MSILSIRISLIGLDFDDGNTEADTSIDTDGSWIGWDYGRVSRVMLFPCFSSASLKGVLWSGLSHYQATVWVLVGEGWT